MPRAVPSSAWTGSHRRLAALGHRGRRVRGGAAAGLRSLTPQELDVARLSARGHTAAETGRQPFIGTRTVETHLAHACGKLGVASKRVLLHLAGELDRTGPDRVSKTP
jgi:DNA-binding CsgD family transcriptional regulator